MGMAQEFKKFILRGNVVDLAIGVVIGGAFGGIVTSLVKDIFTPLIGFAKQGIDFTKYELEIQPNVKLGIGSLVQASLTFLIVAFCMFLVVKGMNIMNRKKEEATEPAKPTPTEALLTEIRDLLKK